MLYIVIPCYKKEEVILQTCKLFKLKIDELVELGKIDVKSRVFFVNDGSKDDTWKIIECLSRDNEAFDGITSLSIKPIRVITVFGILVAFCSFVGVIWSVCSYFLGNTVSG